MTGGNGGSNPVGGGKHLDLLLAGNRATWNKALLAVGNAAGLLGLESLLGQLLNGLGSGVGGLGEGVGKSLNDILSGLGSGAGGLIEGLTGGELTDLLNAGVQVGLVNLNTPINVPVDVLLNIPVNVSINTNVALETSAGNLPVGK